MVSSVFIFMSNGRGNGRVGRDKRRLIEANRPVHPVVIAARSATVAAGRSAPAVDQGASARRDQRVPHAQVKDAVRGGLCLSRGGNGSALSYDLTNARIPSIVNMLGMRNPYAIR